MKTKITSYPYKDALDRWHVRFVTERETEKGIKRGTMDFGPWVDEASAIDGERKILEGAGLAPTFVRKPGNRFDAMTATEIAASEARTRKAFGEVKARANWTGGRTVQVMN